MHQFWATKQPVFFRGALGRRVQVTGLLPGGRSSPMSSRKGAETAVTAAHLQQPGGRGEHRVPPTHIPSMACAPAAHQQPSPQRGVGLDVHGWQHTPAGLGRRVGRVDGQCERDGSGSQNIQLPPFFFFLIRGKIFPIHLGECIQNGLKRYSLLSWLKNKNKTDNS